MYVIDDTVLNDPAIDPYVVRGVRALGMRGMRSPDGKVLFGAYMHDNTWMIVEPVGEVTANSRDEAWISGRVDATGAGFRRDRPETFHQAAVDAIRTPCPIYERGMDSGIVDALVGSEADAKALLVEALTTEPAQQMAV
jgi:hypothetical protein